MTNIQNIFPVKSSILNKDGNYLLFSLSDFVNRICTGPCCFVCGKDPREVEFNDEHIVPNWVLRRFKLHSRNLTLPNGAEHKYGTYTIPCCHTCNSNMSVFFEDIMSGLHDQGSSALQDYIAENGSLVPYAWMALIFLKAHLKDNKLRKNLDRRQSDEPISSDYLWEHMHHLHAVARAFQINATITHKATGSMYVFPIRPEGTNDAFDIVTFTEAQTLYIRLGSTGIIAVFDDACAALNRVMWIIEKIEGPLSWAQAREVAVHMAVANLDLINRPQFWTNISPNGEVTINGQTDTVPKFREFDPSVFGHVMESAFRRLPPIQGCTANEAEELLRDGKLSFLFDCDGNFIKDHTPVAVAES